MTARPRRPSVLDLGSLMVNPPPASAPALAPAVTAPEPSDEPSEEARGTLAKPTVTADPAMFRTSVYFSRVVHDKLRDIAHEERKTITDLINEGLDHVLATRNYPSTAELRDEAKSKRRRRG